MGNTHRLFTEFPPVSTEKWEEQIIKDLKGQDYDRRLCWKTIDGFTLNPYYRADDLDKLDYLISTPDSFPYTRGNSTDNTWLINQTIIEPDPEKANKMALSAIEGGVNYLSLNAAEVISLPKLTALLKDIDINVIHLGFYNQNCNRFLRNLITEFAVNNNFDKLKIKGSFEADPFGSILISGDYSDNLQILKRRYYELIDSLDTHLPNFRGITIQGQNFHNAGATATQELAYVLSLGVEYVSLLTEQELPIDRITPFLQFSFGIGSDYFIEIAKIRAARMLWSKIVEQYSPKNEESCKIHIHGETSNYNKSIFDPHTNMLRVTTEAMSALIGGVDSLEIKPFDKLYKNPNEFSARIAKNVQLLLKEESYLDKVADPSAGSYYIETITDKIAQSAWMLFKEIESKGGYLESIEKGFIQNQISETVKKRDELVSKKKEHILGASLYPNTTESVLENIELPATDNETTLKTVFQTIKPYRKAKPFEDLRLQTENYIAKGNKIPVVFILPVGNPAMASARQIFSRNFFGCAGFEIIENARFSSVDQGVEKALGMAANLIVVCSADDEYSNYCAEIIEKISKEKSDMKLIVAGYPEDKIEELSKTGVYDFIHMKTNLLQSLGNYQKLFNII